MISSNKLKFQGSIQGLTLLEVVMALGIMSLLFIVVFGSLSSINRSKKTLDDYQDVYLVAQSLLRRISREFQLVTCTKEDNSSKCNKSKGTLPDPDDSNQKTGPVFLARHDQSGSNNSITFLAVDAGQYLPDAGVRTGMVQITYRLGKIDKADNLFTLIRDELPYLLPAAEAYKKRLTFPLTKNVVKFSFNFFDRDSDSWTEDWGNASTSNSTSSPALPTLIKFTLVLRTANGIDLPFETIVPVRAALRS